MNNVIPFKGRRYEQAREPTMTIHIHIHIYDNGDDKGFSYVVTGQGEPPTREQLQSYLGDMFMTLNGGPDRSRSIWKRLRAFLSRK